MPVVKTLDLSRDGAHIRQIFQTGGIFAYPTEGVFGLGGNPYLVRAYQKIVALKGREKGKGMIVVGADWTQLCPFIAMDFARLQALIRPWQGQRATTFVLPAAPQAPAYLRDKTYGNIALRVSSHPVVAALCRLCAGPLLSTSANPTGMSPGRTTARVQEYFPDIPVVEGTIGNQTRPSRIVDVITNTVLRD